MRILCVNAGSSSLKLSVLDDEDAVVFRTTVSTSDGPEQLDDVLADQSVDVVAHRIVHGGSTFTRAALIDDKLVGELRRLGDLAPLHQGPSLQAVDTVRRTLPTVPMVACFDTAFHASLPVAARTYALPAAWKASGQVRRYGFHGLSYAYATRRAAELLDRPIAQLRLVICHLGSGASLCAVDRGRSVDTTMGFTPLEGLVMGTRSGSIDPALVLWLQRRGLGLDELESGLLHDSGLKGLAGASDVAELEERAAAGEAAAATALDVYVHRLSAEIAAMAASLDGLDALVFTGGVGEHSALVRERAVGRLGFLGVALDPVANGSASPDLDVSAASARTRCLVIEAREDLQLAAETRELLGS